MTDALSASGLCKRYRSTWALRECDLALPAGRVIALVGPNGAGKTTLLRLTVGLLSPTSGSIEVFGSSPTTNTPQALARIGFLAQEHPLYRSFTVADLLHFGASLNIRFDRPLAEKRLASLDIPLNRKAGALSGGQQSQVALALALAKRPDLLVLDEPLSSLDPVARREFLQTLMGAVAQDGITVLFSSHVVHELERVCDYLVVLNNGRIAIDDDIETLLERHKILTGPRSDVHDPMLGAVIEATHSDRHTSLLVRDGAAIEGWQEQPAGLEDVVLAYLRGGVAMDRTKVAA
ncbi:ABC transporter ATP-binding protein [Dactylosporangium sp. NPDC049140]|uniref:ABC transporter ATP-binding protein n=1 Tax=Dactylosporangium sp. NPDC049140 TaxID=3155647 RepID=UPI0033FB4DC3